MTLGAFHRLKVNSDINSQMSAKRLNLTYYLILIEHLYISCNLFHFYAGRKTLQLSEVTLFVSRQIITSLELDARPPE